MFKDTEYRDSFIFCLCFFKRFAYRSAKTSKRHTHNRFFLAEKIWKVYFSHEKLSLTIYQRKYSSKTLEKTSKTPCQKSYGRLFEKSTQK